MMIMKPLISRSILSFILFLFPFLSKAETGISLLISDVRPTYDKSIPPLDDDNPTQVEVELIIKDF